MSETGLDMGSPKSFRFWAEYHGLETSEPYIFFSTPQNLTKFFLHKDDDEIYLWKKFQIFWSIFEHSDFMICSKSRLPEHFPSIFSTVAFSQKLGDFIDRFSK